MPSVRAPSSSRRRGMTGATSSVSPREIGATPTSPLPLPGSSATRRAGWRGKAASAGGDADRRSGNPAMAMSGGTIKAVPRIEQIVIRPPQRILRPPSATKRIGITIGAALEIGEQQIVAIAADDVIGQQRNLAAAAGRIDDKLRHGVAGGVAAQPPNDFEALLDRGAEVLRTGNRVALIEVIGFYPRLEQPLHQRLHHLDRIVDALEQHRLAAERNAGIVKAGAGFNGFGG